MNKGKFIVFDGGEGSGKSTVSKFVVKELQKQGISALWTREPGGSPLAEEIRTVLFSKNAKDADYRTLMHLFWASRSDHLYKTIIPALKKGMHVISDRFDSSTYAYQVYAGNKRDDITQEERIESFWEDRESILAEHQPDQYLFFAIDPKVGLARTRSRGGEITHFDTADIEFHKKVKEGFYEFFTGMNPWIINAEASLNIVQESVLRIVKEVIEK